jgi:uncharacterized membrane protein YphA (DoxX/SURF4 family)
MNYTSPIPLWLIPIGRIFFAIGVIGIGVQHFIFADFIPVIVPAWPAWIPGHHFWPYVVGAALIAAGLAIVFNIRARTVAAVLGAAFLFLVIFDHIPAELAASPAHLGAWTNAFKALTLCGGAWTVVGSLAESNANHNGLLETLMPFGRYFLPITVVAFGFDHFLYPVFVASLVPKWIPGPVFWTYFAAVALIASGVAMIANVQARLAALMLGIMILLWFIMLHLPRAIADPHSGNGNEWTSVCEALAFSGIAFVLAALPASNRFAISSSK